MVGARTSHVSTTGPPGSGGVVWHTYAALHGEASHSLVGVNPFSGGHRSGGLHLRRLVTLGRTSASGDASEAGLAYAILHPGYGLGFLAGLFEFWNRWEDKRGRVPEFKPRETGD